MSYNVRYEWDTSQWDHELDRLGELHHAAIEGLEAVLDLAFTATQAVVHIQTGSLKSSGKTESDLHGEVWEGAIEYGGSSNGFPNDPVEYAIYEWERGGTHDFMRPAELFDDAYAEAIIEGQFVDHG